MDPGVTTLCQLDHVPSHKQQSQSGDKESVTTRAEHPGNDWQVFLYAAYHMLLALTPALAGLITAIFLELLAKNPHCLPVHGHQLCRLGGPLVCASCVCCSWYCEVPG